MTGPHVAETIIRPRTGWIPINVRDIWEFRDLLLILTWRDVKVKYKQSLLGIAWVILRPVIMMLVFSLLFGRLAKMPSEGVPYPIFVFLGLLPWTYFSGVLGEATTGIIGGSNLISKVYFPRLLIPLSTALSNLVDLLVSMSILFVLMAYYRIVPPANALLLPLLIAAVVLAALGPGIFLGALNVRYRDVRYIIPFLIQIWMFMTPVIYPVKFIPETYQWLMYLNPMAGPIESFRSALLGHTEIELQGLAISVAVSLTLFFVSLYYFKRVEREFADII